MKALLIIDVQNDFCSGGELAAPKGDQVVPVINNLINKFDIVLASRDNHPPESDHFKKWPVHCVTGTEGVQFHPDLDTSNIEKELVKGTDGIDDGYSAFEAKNMNLTQYLQNKNVDEVYVAGLTAEYCVKESAIDSSRNGFKTYVITDAVAAVKPESDDELDAYISMKSEGVIMIKSSEIN